MQVLVEVTMEVDEAAFTGSAFWEVVLEQAPEHGEVVVTAALFVMRYMARPIITTMATTTAATTAAATPARDSNFTSTDQWLISWLAITLRRD
jgi:hypothetical protein